MDWLTDYSESYELRGPNTYRDRDNYMVYDKNNESNSDIIDKFKKWFEEYWLEYHDPEELEDNYEWD